MIKNYWNKGGKQKRIVIILALINYYYSFYETIINQLYCF